MADQSEDGHPGAFLKEFKMNTQAYRTRLTQKLQAMRCHHVSQEDIATGRNADMMDEIQQTSERELALETMSRDWKTSNAVNAALARIAGGTYGICGSCEEPINERRLDAIPWAEQCIVCQHRAEHEQEPALAVAA
jgi:RNA polymerase-binding protein DksA